VIFAGGGYEVYDPYTGNVTVLMGGPPPGHYPPVVHPMLAAVPYQPMPPLQPVDWFSPSSPSANDHHWMSSGAVYHHQQSGRHHKKSTAEPQQQQVSVRPN